MHDAPGATEVRTFGWISMHPVRDRMLAEALGLDLDIGEAEAIALAVEQQADLLLMDERRGRHAAGRLNQPVIGVLGVLIEAKHRGYLLSVRPVLESLVSGAGFRISDALHARVLEAAGE